jgi:hypothetical protein
MTDPSACNHEWVDDGTLEVFPPIRVSHCVKCGLIRHIKSGGAITYIQPSASGQPGGSVSSPTPDDPSRAE